MQQFSIIIVITVVAALTFIVAIRVFPDGPAKAEKTNAKGADVPLGGAEQKVA